MQSISAQLSGVQPTADNIPYWIDVFHEMTQLWYAILEDREYLSVLTAKDENRENLVDYSKEFVIYLSNKFVSANPPFTPWSAELPDKVYHFIYAEMNDRKQPDSQPIVSIYANREWIKLYYEVCGWVAAEFDERGDFCNEYDENLHGEEFVFQLTEKFTKDGVDPDSDMLWEHVREAIQETLDGKPKQIWGTVTKYRVVLKLKSPNLLDIEKYYIGIDGHWFLTRDIKIAATFLTKESAEKAISESYAGLEIEEFKEQALITTE